MRRLAALALVAALLAGCGGDGEKSTGTAPEAPEPAGPIAIFEPEEGERLKAEEDGGRLGLLVPVSGTADAGADVVVSGGCSAQDCVVHATADDGGRWRAEVRLEAPAGDPAVRITAYYRGDPIVGPDDRVAVRLAGPGPERRRRGGGGPGTLILIGDSLAEGIEPHLPALLPGWRIHADALTSRPLDVGMGILARTRVPPGSVIAMSLFTNDDPSRTEALEAGVRESVRRAGPRGCAVWATIARPPFDGRSYAAANALLRSLDTQLGRRLAVVPWAELAGRSGWLAGDGVHATPEGFRHRARLYAEAAQGCGG